MQQRQIVVKMGISLGKTNYCIKSLMEKRLVIIRNFHRNDKK